MSISIDFKSKWRDYTIVIIAVLLFVLQIAAMYFAKVQAMPHRMIFVCLTMILYFIKPSKNKMETAINYIFCILCTVICVFALVYSTRITTRIVHVHPLFMVDKALGVLLILMILEGTRRIAGNVLFFLGLGFVIYGFAGPYMPGILRHSGFTLKSFVDTNFMSNGGVFGSATSAVISYVFYFLLFTTFLEVSGGGKLFIDAALTIAGRSRGGTAKAGVVASGLMGMISGSAVANVVGVGSLCIPIMKKHGLDGETSGGVIAAASTGGQLMPPIMGSAAFIMAESTATPYGKIALAAAIPAFFYYFGIFAQVDFFAKKKGLQGLTKEQLPDIKASAKQYGHLMIPLIALVYYIGVGSSIMMAGLKSTAMLIILSYLRKGTRMTPTKIIDGLVQTVKGLPTIVFPCATAGIIIGTVIQSNLATKLSSIFIAISGGNLLISLLACMIVCIIFGMGMPTISAYIIVSMLLVPTIIELGVPLLAAHLFAFYFALLSFVTPPVALSAYTAAGIANADPTKTGWKAFIFTFAGFIVPFIFAFDQSLLLEGSVINILVRFVLTFVAVWLLAGSIVGWFFTNASVIFRILGGIIAIIMIIPGTVSDVVGVAGAIVLLSISYLQSKKDKEEKGFAIN